MCGLLDNKVALVTGAGRGIGRGIAKVLARENAAVVVSDVHLDWAQETVCIINEHQGKSVSIAIMLDVTSPQDIRSAIDTCINSFGKIDILVNNAGVCNLKEPLELSAEEFRKTLEVNVIGAFLCAQAFAQKLIDMNAGGSIVNIASVAGKVGFRQMLDYNVSKAALINLTRSLALELASHAINVNAVCPGAVDTEMLLGCAKWFADKNGSDIDELMQSYASDNQLNRLTQPEEIGEIVAFLASNNAVLIRGQSINADAGTTPY